jgi:hypothetical protein
MNGSVRQIDAACSVRVNVLTPTTRQKDFVLGAGASLGLMLLLTLVSRVPGLAWAGLILLLDAIGWALFFRIGLRRRWLLVGAAGIPLLLYLGLFTLFSLAAGE